LGDRDYADLVDSDRVRDMVDEDVQRLNWELNRWETIKKWEILDHDLSIELGELTPSLKVKRSVIADEQKDLIDSFYS
jgi:long-chain acyl-CoA synthetase